MNKLSLGFAFFGVLGLSSVAHADGKEKFLEYKCNKCHSVDSHKIEQTKEKQKGGDLSEVGKTRDADWMMKYIKKEVTNDEDKKHKGKFKGTDEELKAIVDWCATLKG